MIANILFFIGALVLLLAVIALVVLFYYRMYESLNKVADEDEARAQNLNTTQERLEKKFDKRTDNNKQLVQDLKKKHDTRLQEHQESISQNRNVIQKNKDETESALRDMGDKMSSEISILDEDMNKVFEELDEFGDEFQDYRQFQRETSEDLEKLREAEASMRETMDQKIPTSYRFEDGPQDELSVTHPELDKDKQALRVSNMVLENNLRLSPTSMLHFGNKLAVGLEQDGTLSLFELTGDGKRDTTKDAAHRLQADGVAKHKKGMETKYVKIGNYTFKEKGDRLYIVNPYTETEYDLISSIMEGANNNNNNSNGSSSSPSAPSTPPPRDTTPYEEELSAADPEDNNWDV